MELDDPALAGDPDDDVLADRLGKHQWLEVAGARDLLAVDLEEVRRLEGGP